MREEEQMWVVVGQFRRLRRWLRLWRERKSEETKKKVLFVFESPEGSSLVVEHRKVGGEALPRSVALFELCEEHGVGPGRSQW